MSCSSHCTACFEEVIEVGASSLFSAGDFFLSKQQQQKRRLSNAASTPKRSNRRRKPTKSTTFTASFLPIAAACSSVSSAGSGTTPPNYTTSASRSRSEPSRSLAHSSSINSSSSSNKSMIYDANNPNKNNNTKKRSSQNSEFLSPLNSNGPDQLNGHGMQHQIQQQRRATHNYHDFLNEVVNGSEDTTTLGGESSMQTTIKSRDSSPLEQLAALSIRDEVDTPSLEPSANQSSLEQDNANQTDDQSVSLPPAHCEATTPIISRFQQQAALSPFSPLLWQTAAPSIQELTTTTAATTATATMAGLGSNTPYNGHRPGPSMAETSFAASPPLVRWQEPELSHLSLSPCRTVSVVVNVHTLTPSLMNDAPIKATNARSGKKSAQSASDPTMNLAVADPSNTMCLFPLLTSQDQYDAYFAPPQVRQSKKGSKSSSVSMSSFSSRDIIMVNPTAFGKYLPPHQIMTLETARQVAQTANISSEDWIRQYTFQHVWWPPPPGSLVSGPSSYNAASAAAMHHLCQALAHDVTQPGSISSRLVIGVGENAPSIHGQAAGAAVQRDATQLKAATAFNQIHGDTNGSSTSGFRVKTHTLFGNLATQSVATVLASARTTQNLIVADVLQMYGLLGMTASEIFRLQQEQAEDEDATAPPPILCTVSVLEVADEDILIDLLEPPLSSNHPNQSRPFGSGSSLSSLTGGTISGTASTGHKVHLRYHTQRKGAVVMGLHEVPVDSLKAVGHVLRRALARSSANSSGTRAVAEAAVNSYLASSSSSATTRGSGGTIAASGTAAGTISAAAVGRGHVIATLKIWQTAPINAAEAVAAADGEPVQYRPTKCTAAVHFVDVATIEPESLAGDPSVVAAMQRRNAFVRKSVWALGGVLRGTLINEHKSSSDQVSSEVGGNSAMMSFRESTLTKVLQRWIDCPDSRAVVMASVSPATDQYETSMATLRYVSRLLYKPGQTPQSPFDLVKTPHAKERRTPGSASSHDSENLSAEDSPILGAHQVGHLRGTSPSSTLSSHSPGMGRAALGAGFSAAPWLVAPAPGQENLWLHSVVSDPRQRLARLMRPVQAVAVTGEEHGNALLDTPATKVAGTDKFTHDGQSSRTESDEASAQRTNYMQVDPGASWEESEEQQSAGRATPPPAPEVSLRDEETQQGHCAGHTPLADNRGNDGKRRIPGEAVDGASKAAPSNEEGSKMPDKEQRPPPIPYNHDLNGAKGDDPASHLNQGDDVILKQRSIDTTFSLDAMERGAEFVHEEPSPLTTDEAFAAGSLHNFGDNCVDSDPLEANGAFREGGIYGEAGGKGGYESPDNSHADKYARRWRPSLDDSNDGENDPLLVVEDEDETDGHGQSARPNGSRVNNDKISDSATAKLKPVDLYGANNPNQFTNPNPDEIQELTTESSPPERKESKSKTSPLKITAEPSIGEVPSLKKDDEISDASKKSSDEKRPSDDLSSSRSGSPFKRKKPIGNASVTSDPPGHRGGDYPSADKAAPTKNAFTSSSQLTGHRNERTWQHAFAEDDSDLDMPIEPAKTRKISQDRHVPADDYSTAESKSSPPKSSTGSFSFGRDAGAMSDSAIQTAQQNIMREIDALQAAIDLVKRSHFSIWKRGSHSIESIRRHQAIQQATLASLAEELAKAESESQTARKEMNDRSEELYKHIDRLVRERDEALKDFHRIQMERSEVERIADEAIADQAELERTVDSLRKELSELSSLEPPLATKQRLDALAQENVSLRKELAAHHDEALRYQARLSELQAHVSDLRSTLRGHEEARLTLTHDRARQLQEVDHLKKELKQAHSLSGDHSSQREENASLRRQMEQLEALLAQRESQLKQQLRDQESSTKLYRRELEKKQRDVDQQRSEMEQSQRELLEWKGNASRQQQDSSVFQAKMDDAERRVSRESRAKEVIEQELEHTRDELDRRISDVKDLSASLKKVVSERDEAQKRVSKMEGLLETMKKETRNRVEAVVRRHEEKSAELEKTMVENSSLVEKNHELRIALDDLLRDRDSRETSARVPETRRSTVDGERWEKSAQSRGAEYDCDTIPHAHRHDAHGQGSSTRMAPSIERDEDETYATMASRADVDWASVDTFHLKQQLYDAEIEALKARIRSLERRSEVTDSVRIVRRQPRQQVDGRDSRDSRSRRSDSWYG